jgi:hypothetical protein
LIFHKGASWWWLCNWRATSKWIAHCKCLGKD